MKKSLIAALIAATALCGAACASVPIGIPDDPTNGARAIKLLETAGLITVDPAAGFYPEVKDITGYIYDVEVVPAAANTLPATLDDFGASIINGNFATPAGLVPSRDALIIEKQQEGGGNPFINSIVARTADKDNPLYKPIVDAYHTQIVAEFMLARYKEAILPVFDYDPDFTVPEGFVDEINAYRSSKDGKKVVKVGVCGAGFNDQWNAVQKVLDDRGEGIYLEIVEFDAFNLPNEALNSGDIDLNAFQHKAYLKKEVESQGYEIEPIGDTLIGPLALFSRKAKTLDGLKALAGKK